jgi:putative phage-type endonuclease
MTETEYIPFYGILEMTTFTTEDRIIAEKDGSLTINVQQGSDEWHQLRLGKVTASRVADILAKTKTGPSASRQNYLIELALQRVTKTIEESYTSQAMTDGIEREGQARVLYEVTTGEFVDQAPFINHPTIQGFGASPDGLVNTKGMCEIKCRNNANHWEVIKTGEIPKKYWIQQQAQLSCTGREWNDYVGYNPNFPDKSKLFVKRVFRDEIFIAEMESEVKQFLSEVEKEVELMRSR